MSNCDKVGCYCLKCSRAFDRVGLEGELAAKDRTISELLDLLQRVAMSVSTLASPDVAQNLQPEITRTFDEITKERARYQ